MKKFSDKELEKISECSVSIKFPPQDGEGIREINIPISELGTLLIQLSEYNHRKITGEY